MSTNADEMDPPADWELMRPYIFGQEWRIG